MKSTKKKGKTPITTQALIEQANIALNKLQPELASSFYKRALDLEPTNTNIMDAYADILLQLGNMQEALVLLRNSTSMAPEENPYKWLFLAQLQHGLEALESYNKAIEYMSRLATINSDIVTKNDDIKKHIAKAYVSIAELYLTDLCFEENAESCAETAILKAFDIIPDLMDAQQTLASIRMSQNRPQDACMLMSQVYQKVMIIRERIHSRTIVDEITATEDPNEYNDDPELEFCIATAKLLVECGVADNTMIECALELLADLLEEDDDNIEIWYICGVASLSLHPPDLDGARYHLEGAKEMMEKLKEHCQEANEEFPYLSQYDLLSEHFSMLEEWERKKESGEITNDTMADENEHRQRIFGQRRKQDHENRNEMMLADDDEWSTCDEAENEEENQNES